MVWSSSLTLDGGNMLKSWNLLIESIVWLIDPSTYSALTFFSFLPFLGAYSSALVFLPAITIQPLLTSFSQPFCFSS
jgi:hypothetical protein